MKSRTPLSLFEKDSFFNKNRPVHSITISPGKPPISNITYPTAEVQAVEHDTMVLANDATDPVPQPHTARRMDSGVWYDVSLQDTRTPDMLEPESPPKDSSQMAVESVLQTQKLFLAAFQNMMLLLFNNNVGEKKDAMTETLLSLSALMQGDLEGTSILPSQNSIIVIKKILDRNESVFSQKDLTVALQKKLKAPDIKEVLKDLCIQKVLKQLPKEASKNGAPLAPKFEVLSWEELKTIVREV